LIPPIVPGPTFTIRRKAVRVFTLEDYVTSGIMTARQRAAIERSARSRLNILVVGGTTTGKTTLTNAILRYIAEADPNHRIVIIEDTAELQCTIENKVMLPGDVEGARGCPPNDRCSPPLRAAPLPWWPRSCQPRRLKPGRGEHFFRCVSEPSRSAHPGRRTPPGSVRASQP
jgi:hypothetical protein